MPPPPPAAARAQVMVGVVLMLIVAGLLEGFARQLIDNTAGRLDRRRLHAGASGPPTSSSGAAGSGEGRLMARRATPPAIRMVITPEGVSAAVRAGHPRFARGGAADRSRPHRRRDDRRSRSRCCGSRAGSRRAELEGRSPKAQALQALVVVWIIAMFLARNAWFLFFELGPRGATPGKRITGIRVAARGTERLTTEAVIARNIIRDIELFMPAVFIGAAFASGSDTDLASWGAVIWFLIFVLFPSSTAMRCAAAM